MHISLSLTFLSSLLLLASAQCPPTLKFAIGTLTKQPWLPTAAGVGVSVLAYNDPSFALTSIFGPSVVGENPSFLAASSDRIYAVNENEKATVSSVSIQNGTFMKATTFGASAAHIHRDGMLLVISNFGGSIATVGSIQKRLVPLQNFTIPLKLAAASRNASLKGNWRFDTPHPHMALPFKQYYAVPDLGSGMVHLFKISKCVGSITLVSSTEIGQIDGPRHAVVHPRGNVLYVVNELSLTISTMYLSGKRLVQRARTELTQLNKAERKDVYAAAIRVSADGNFLYTSVRFDDSNNGKIVGFRLNKRTGQILQKVTEVSTHGIHPRDFIIIEKLTYKGECVSVLVVVNRDSNNLVMIRRDIGSGTLHETIMTQTMVDTPTSVVKLDS